MGMLSKIEKLFLTKGDNLWTAYSTVVLNVCSKALQKAEYYGFLYFCKIRNTFYSVYTEYITSKLFQIYCKILVSTWILTPKFDYKCGTQGPSLWLYCNLSTIIPILATQKQVPSTPSSTFYACVFVWKCFCTFAKAKF